MTASSGVGHPSQAVLIPTRSAKKGQVWPVPSFNGRRHTFDLAIPGAFHRLLSLIGPIENSTCLNSMSDFTEEAHNIRGRTISTRYAA